jgi:hypothetical protein
MTMIIGFAMLILGNYILYAIFGALCWGDKIWENNWEKNIDFHHHIVW